MTYGYGIGIGRFQFEVSINFSAWGIGIATHVDEFIVGAAIGIGPVLFAVEFAR